MKSKIKIGSRGSKLALIYAQKAKNEIIRNTNFDPNDIIIKEIKTKGDHINDIRLSEVGGKGMFCSTIEEELKENKIDIAIHALKDMPAIETDGLITNSFLKRNDSREVLITKDESKNTLEFKKHYIIYSEVFSKFSKKSIKYKLFEYNSSTNKHFLNVKQIQSICEKLRLI